MKCIVERKKKKECLPEQSAVELEKSRISFHPDSRNSKHATTGRDEILKIPGGEEIHAAIDTIWKF